VQLVSASTKLRQMFYTRNFTKDFSHRNLALTGGPVLAQSGRWVVRLRFRLITLAGPSSAFPMMDWSESSSVSIS